MFPDGLTCAEPGPSASGRKNVLVHKLVHGKAKKPRAKKPSRSAARKAGRRLGERPDGDDPWRAVARIVDAPDLEPGTPCQMIAYLFREVRKTNALKRGRSPDRISARGREPEQPL